MAALTELMIRKLPHPREGNVKHVDPSLPGFGIRCAAKSKSFFVMYGQKRCLKTLGRWPELSLKDARQAAKQQDHAQPDKARRSTPPIDNKPTINDCTSSIPASLAHPV